MFGLTFKDLDKELHNIKTRYIEVVEYTLYIEECLTDQQEEYYILEEKYNKLKEELERYKNIV